MNDMTVWISPHEPTWRKDGVLMASQHGDYSCRITDSYGDDDDEIDEELVLLPMWRYGGLV